MAGVVSPVAGTRTEPTDGYKFVRGTTATFKVTFSTDGRPTTVDNSTVPVAKILLPNFLSDSNNPMPTVFATLQGSLVPGQQFEYQFVWNIPPDMMPLDEYIVSYEAQIGALQTVWGDEYFTIDSTTGQTGILTPAYATVDDIRQTKFNIDDYLPKTIAQDLVARNNMIQSHLQRATQKLRNELNMTKKRGMSENYKLFTIYYTIFTILLASRGEDGSSVSDQNLMFWKGEWEKILAQEKRESVLQGVPMGRG